MPLTRNVTWSESTAVAAELDVEVTVERAAGSGEELSDPHPQSSTTNRGRPKLKPGRFFIMEVSLFEAVVVGRVNGFKR